MTFRLIAIILTLPGLSWPPQIPPEWLQLMQSSMQSGMIPPPLPGLSFPPPSVPHTPQTPATPIAFPSQLPPQFSIAASPSKAPPERVQEVMDSDREDGELSDAEAVAQAPAGPIGVAGIAMRQRYEAPRSAPQPTIPPSHVQDTYNPDQPSAGQPKEKASAVNAMQQANAVANELDLVQQQREEAKQFIRLMNANNIGYHTLAKENIDLELLRGLYRSMNLPSEPEPITAPKTNGTVAKPSNDAQTSAKATGVPQKSAPSVSTNIAAASTASAAPSPVDRKDYLARLQAAKLARQSGPTKTSPPHKSPSVAAGSPATGLSTPQATMTPTKKPPVTDEQKARQTELIKQRLEALKAQSKQNAAPSNNTAMKPAVLQATNQQPPTSGAVSATPQSSGLPGLFTNAPSSTSNGTSTPSRQPQAITQKGPAHSDTSVSTPRGSVTPYNRTYGQSPLTHQEDSMIIEVSEDESNGSDMDIDDEQASTGPSVIRQGPGSVPGFPPRQAPVPAATSTVGTPGPQTPATLARTGELNTKEQELAALKMTLKKKLAEQKRIKEAAEAATAAASAAAASSTARQDSSSKQRQQAPAPTARSVPASVSASGVESSRDRKRRRRTEIQEQLPTLDDEIASNEAEMARLARDLERLKANNARIVQDKARLTKELESLGIDTEGMSHADMQATKDEIERAKSPEVDSAPQSANQVPPGVSANAESGDSVPFLVQAEAAPAAGSITIQTPASGSLANAPQFGFLPGLGQPAPTGPDNNVPESTRLPARDQSSGDLPDSPPGMAPVEAPHHINNRNDRASATPMDDDEDFYSPPPVEVDLNVAPVTQGPDHQVEQDNTTAQSRSEEGEIEMSESSQHEDEEEYEPEEPMIDEPGDEDEAVGDPALNEHVAESTSQQAQLPEPPVENSQALGQSQVSTEDEEAYEPPDVDEEMTENERSAVAAQPAVSSPEGADDGAMDIATSSDESSDDSDSESEGETQSELGDSESQIQIARQRTNVADDLVPGLQSGTSLEIVPAAEQSLDVSTLPMLEKISDSIRCLLSRKSLSLLRSLPMKAPYACSSPIVTTPTSPKTLMAVSYP